MNRWIICVNSRTFETDKFYRDAQSISWHSVTKNSEHIRIGDGIAVWLSGSRGGLVGFSIVTGTARTLTDHEFEESKLYNDYPTPNMLVIDMDPIPWPSEVIPRSKFSLDSILSRHPLILGTDLSSAHPLSEEEWTQLHVLSEESDSFEVSWMLKPGQRVKRTDLHTQFGGSGRHGISVSSSTDNILLFSSAATSESFGYRDEWHGDTFIYTGEGKAGDQTFRDGNKSIRDAAKNKQHLRLFNGARGIVEYVGEFFLDPDHPYFREKAPQADSDEIRQVIRFRLRQGSIPKTDLFSRPLRVLIQPSRGRAIARANWEETMIGDGVDIDTIEKFLTEDERRSLKAAHPQNSAPIWGLTPDHQKLFQDLQPGDLVLFTGQNEVYATAYVGTKFANAEVGYHLWSNRGDKRYELLYSLIDLKIVKVPYTTIWEIQGFNAGDNFQGARFAKEESVEDLLSLFEQNRPDPSDEAETSDDKRARALLSRSVDIENYHVQEFLTHHKGGTQKSRRTEARLVALYIESLPTETETNSRIVGGYRTDICTTSALESGGIRTELIEAKSSSSPASVRMAIGQVLHYAKLLENETFDRLAILLPARPESHLLNLSLCLGIDVIYMAIKLESSAITFERIPASSTSRQHINAALTANIAH